MEMSDVETELEIVDPEVPVLILHVRLKVSFAPLLSVPILQLPAA